MRLVVTGGRNYTNKTFVYSVLSSYDISFLGVGDAKGVDSLAREYAVENNIPYKVFKADWNLYGKKAGPIRNELMLEDIKPDLVIAFRGGRGTEDCARKAMEKSIPVLFKYDKAD
jgi:hypothetical protein